MCSGAEELSTPASEKQLTLIQPRVYWLAFDGQNRNCSQKLTRE
jgi:hypothetical protein